MKKKKNIRHQYLCSAEKEGKIVDIVFRRNRYSVLEYKNMQEKLGRKVSISLIEWCENDSLANNKIVRKCNASKLKYPAKKGWSKRVICIETGEIYNTILQCQTLNKIGSWVIREVLYKGREFEGRHYKIIDE